MLGWFDPAQWTVLNRILESYSRSEAEAGKPTLRRGHSRLRSYSLYPFRIEQEVAGSIAFLSQLLPPGKRVEVLQWSGTTLVPESVLEAARQAGVRNINGGDTRFDPEFDSYAWVAPLGRQAGGQRQVYSSESNEDTYTNLWNERYFGFRYLRGTLHHTETPMRIKPFNLYYHMYSGEKQASLDAVLSNLRYARSLELAPLATSQYCAIVEGFHAATITQLGPRRWRIENRDGLDTLRFDHADGERVDFAASAGVIGQRYMQGSLYVALDAAERDPIIALAAIQRPGVFSRPYLIESRWQIHNVRAAPGRCEFQARGFGPGEMEWQVAPGRTYEIQVIDNHGLVESGSAAANREGTLRFTIAHSALQTLSVRLFEAGGRK